MKRSWLISDGGIFEANLQGPMLGVIQRDVVMNPFTYFINFTRTITFFLNQFWQ